MSILNRLGRSADRLKSARLRYFAQRLVYPRQLPDIMRKHIYTGAMGSIWGILITGQFFVFYATRIGMTKTQMALLSGCFSVLMVTQVFSGFITQRLGRRKLIWFTFCLTNRLVRLAGILLSMLLWHYGWSGAVPVLIIGICLAGLASAQEAPPWLSWLGDIIPEHTHGRFWGRRSAWIALSNILVFLPAGLLLDHVPEPWKLTTIISIFIFATASGVADIVIHGTIPEPHVPPRRERAFLRDILVPLRDRTFRPWLSFTSAWQFSATVADAVLNWFIIKDLAMGQNMFGVACLTSLWLLTILFTGGITGVLVDRYGPRRVLFWGHLILSFVPLLWIFATPSSALLLLGVFNVIGSASFNAVVNAATKFVVRFPPPQLRPLYLSAAIGLGALATGLGGLFAALALFLIGDWQYTFAGLPFGGLRLLFILTLILRLLTVTFVLTRLRDSHSPPEPA